MFKNIFGGGDTTTTPQQNTFIDSNITLFDKENNIIPIGDIISVSNIVLPFDAEIEFQLEVIEGSLHFIVKSDYKILKVPVPVFAEISVVNEQLNLLGSYFNKTFSLVEDVLIFAENTAIIRISETWEREDIGSYSMAKLVGANCARFTKPVGLNITLGELGIVFDKDWAITFYVKDNRTNWTPNMLINAGAFYVFINPKDTGGRLIVCTRDTTPRNYDCKTEQEFLEGVFVLNYYAEGKRMMIYFNGDLLYDQAKESVTAWDTTKEVFLAKYRDFPGWEWDPDFNMAGLGIYNRVLAIDEIKAYMRSEIPEDPVLFYPMSEGKSNVLFDIVHISSDTYPIWGSLEGLLDVNFYKGFTAYGYSDGSLKIRDPNGDVISSISFPSYDVRSVLFLTENIVAISLYYKPSYSAQEHRIKVIEFTENSYNELANFLHYRLSYISSLRKIFGLANNYVSLDDNRTPIVTLHVEGSNYTFRRYDAVNSGRPIIVGGCIYKRYIITAYRNNYNNYKVGYINDDGTIDWLKENISGVHSLFNSVRVGDYIVTYDSGTLYCGRFSSTTYDIEWLCTYKSANAILTIESETNESYCYDTQTKDLKRIKCSDDKIEIDSLGVSVTIYSRDRSCLITGGLLYSVVEQLNYNITTNQNWVKQDSLHYNLVNGFRNETGVKVPVIPGQNEAVNGKPLTNFAWDGIHTNGSESYWEWSNNGG